MTQAAEKSDRARSLVWMLAPALLSVASQAGALAYFSRHYGVAEVLSFQSMLSLWAWTLVLAFGMDRSARGFAVSHAGLSEFAARWRTRLIMGSLLGAALGAALGGSWSGGPWAWGAYGAALVACAMGFAGREWMYAKGEVTEVNKSLSTAFIVAMLLQGALAWMDAPFGLVALCWFAPHLMMWMGASARLGLFDRTRAAGPYKWGTSQQEWPYGLQALGHVALGSMDVVVSKAMMASAPEALRFVIYSRLAFVAFMVSANVAATFVSRSVHSSGKAWKVVFFKCTAVHAGCSMVVVAFFAVAGPVVTRAWLGHELTLGVFDAAWLAAAGLGRSVSEAGMQTLSGSKRYGGALSSFGGSTAGLALFAVLLAWSSLGAFAALGISWCVPSLALLCWVMIKGR